MFQTSFNILSLFKRLIGRKKVLVAMSPIVRSILLVSMLTMVWAKHVNVTIVNKLEGNEDLYIHCKSKDNDLGIHLLQINQFFRWSFGTSLFLNTLFFCSFRWRNGPLVYYDVYKEVKDFYECQNCVWDIRKAGPCRYESCTSNSCRLVCYKWN